MPNKMLHQSWHFIKKNQYHFYSFILPVIAMLTTFIVQQVHPFGDKMILTVDLYHQYAPFLMEFKHKILSGESLFFSWTVGMGTNFWAVLANYSASPLNFLSILFPDKYLPDCIAFLAILRTGMTGLFMSFLLCDIDKKRKDLFLPAFAAFYALCGWVVSYFWNIMWHDAVMLLPLIVYGMRLMFRDKKPALYCLSLAVCITSNFYAGFFVCLFLVVYAPICYVSLFDRLNVRNFFRSVWRFAVFSLLGGAMSAFLTLPTYLSLQNASAVGDEFPKKFEITQNLFDFLSRFLFGANPNIRDGMANVYCGLLTLLFVPLFFICRNIRLREKIAYGIGIVYIYLGFASRMLNFVWHGFHFPNQIPYRQAFLLSFLLVIMAYRVLRNLKTFTMGEVTGILLALFGYMVLYEKIGDGQEGYMALGLSLLFLIAYGIILRMVMIGKRSPLFQQIALFSVIVVEVIAATQLTVGLVSMNEGFTGWDFYAKDRDIVVASAEELEGSEGVSNFVRSEIYPAYICDQPALYGIKGISIFSSTARESYVQFVRTLGFHNNGINSIRNYGLTEVTASMFGVRYFYDLYSSSPVPNRATLIDEQGDVHIYENPDALALGYMVNEDIVDYPVENNNNPFTSTNEYLAAMGVSSLVYRSEILIPENQTNAVYRGGGAQSGYEYSVSAGASAEVSFRANVMMDGSHVFLYLTGNQAPTITIRTEDATETIDSEDVITTSSSTQALRTYQIVDLGTYYNTETMHITLRWANPNAASTYVLCYSLIEEGYQDMLATLGDEQWNVETYDSTHVRGTITANEDGILFLSIPLDEGWTATVDGEEATLIPLQEAFMGIRLTAGTHNISLTYKPEGFDMSLKITLAAIVIFAVFAGGPILFRKIWNKRKREDAIFDQGPADTEAQSTADIVLKTNPKAEPSIKTDITEEPDIASREKSADTITLVAVNEEISTSSEDIPYDDIAPINIDDTNTDSHNDETSEPL